MEGHPFIYLRNTDALTCTNTPYFPQRLLKRLVAKGFVFWSLAGFLDKCTRYLSIVLILFYLTMQHVIFIAQSGITMKFARQVLFLSIGMFLCQTISAQEVIRQKACNSEEIKIQADSIKYEMNMGGFILLREASITMESEYEMPVVVPMNEREYYHVVFIGDKTSKLLEVRMFDWNEKQVIYQKSLNDGIDGNVNVLRYTYAPKFSEYHMIKPVQVNKKKKKEVCGYIMLFRRVK
jgi:hypothetical protein